MRLICYACALLCLIAAGCGAKRDRLQGTWFYTHSSSGDGERHDSLTAASFMQFNTDGSYTRDLGKFDYGKWSLLGDTLIRLASEAGQPAELKVQFLSGTELQLITGRDAVANFEMPATVTTKANPFSRENNLWRISATRSESDEEIKARLRNHCRFWEQYFTWALEAQLANVDVRSTPTLIKIYGNGFGLKPLTELPQAWIAYFYDGTDCLRANKQIADIFKHKNIAWAKTQNKFKMFIGAFQQMQQFLK